MKNLQRFEDACTSMAMNGLGSIGEMMEWPSTYWYTAVRSLARIKKEEERRMKHGTR